MTYLNTKQFQCNIATSRTETPTQVLPNNTDENIVNSHTIRAKESQKNYGNFSEVRNAIEIEIHL